MRAYRTVFDARYREHKAEIEAMLAELERRFGGEASARFGEVVAKNTERARFWEAFVAADWSAPGGESGWKEAWDGYYTTARAALETKRSRPLEPVSAEAVLAARTRLQAMLEVLRERNESIAAINIKIEDTKRDVSLEQVERAKLQLARLELVQRRFTPELEALCNQYDKLKREKEEIEKEKSKLQRQRDNATARLLERCKDSVNRRLQEFNAGFSLEEMKPEQAQGKTAAAWAIAIRETPIDVGKKATPREPNFKNTLSAGDRSALAFAFFLAQLEQKPDLAERIVVLDDPFTSQDSHREHITRTMIETLRHKVAQLVVLSHQPRFLLSISDRTGRNVPLSTLEIGCTGGEGSFLRKADLERLVTDRFRLYEAKMISYYKVQEGDPREVAEGLRPYIEQRPKAIFPEKIEPGDTLGTIFRKLEENETVGDGLLDDLRAVNDYCDRWHHATGTEGDTEAPDPAELHGMIRRTLDVFSDVYRAVLS